MELILLAAWVGLAAAPLVQGFRRGRPGVGFIWSLLAYGVPFCAFVSLFFVNYSMDEPLPPSARRDGMSQALLGLGALFLLAPFAGVWHVSRPARDARPPTPDEQPPAARDRARRPRGEKAEPS